MTKVIPEKIRKNWIKIELETTKKAIMADVLQNVVEQEQNKKGSNDEEMEEVTVEEHKVITLHVAKEEKRVQFPKIAYTML